ncbi:N-acetylmuramoyl-L-alanine amidase [Neomegalonema sp.]|uniref:N-acetylmuramoyl-L-alanine amidase n=1 Tax=Neomegalonema sp. TaxID=2039713 RepID=UPI00263A267F|nr:N-acetylmuramoyl-L-alanine amidase [Neomegalonema sp.]MDD2870102.1 N-acetylmuramoyl-L-alanine amidase [Neomegalonema sp.]
MRIFDIQRSLKALGHDPGPLDGVWGGPARSALFSLLYVLRTQVAAGAEIWPQVRLLIAAEQAIMAAHGIDPGVIDGLEGARTLEARRRFSAGAAARPIQTPPGGAIRQGRAGLAVREIILHCAATRPDWMAGRPLREQVEEIRRWHVRINGWRDIGYHWLIGRDGSILPGRPEREIGAHVRGRNSGSLGICLIGGHGSAASDRFSDHYTPAQGAALERLLHEISGRAPIARVSGHNEYAAKACPGFNVLRWLERAES